MRSALWRRGIAAIAAIGVFVALGACSPVVPASTPGSAPAPRPGADNGASRSHGEARSHGASRSHGDARSHGDGAGPARGGDGAASRLGGGDEASAKDGDASLTERRPAGSKTPRKYLDKRTTARDATAAVQRDARSSAQAPASSPGELARRIEEARDARAASQAEGRYDTELLGIVTNGKEATAEFYACCALDDSVAGEHLSVQMFRGARGWSVIGAESRALCYRGVSEDGTLCR